MTAPTRINSGEACLGMLARRFFRRLRAISSVRLEHWIVLPLRWLNSYRRDILEHNQKCKVCGQSDHFDFHVSDDIWEAVVPVRYRTRVVCLKCFDRFARLAGIDYGPYVDYLCFAGDQWSFELENGVMRNLRYCPDCDATRETVVVQREESFLVYGLLETVVSANVRVCSVCGADLFDEQLDGATLDAAYRKAGLREVAPGKWAMPKSAALRPFELSAVALVMDSPEDEPLALRFRKPMLVKPYLQDEGIVFELPELAIVASGATWETAARAFRDDLTWLWREYALADLESLSTDAQGLAGRLRSMVEIVPDGMLFYAT